MDDVTVIQDNFLYDRQTDIPRDQCDDDELIVQENVMYGQSNRKLSVPMIDKSRTKDNNTFNITYDPSETLGAVYSEIVLERPPVSVGIVAPAQETNTDVYTEVTKPRVHPDETIIIDNSFYGSH